MRTRLQHAIFCIESRQALFPYQDTEILELLSSTRYELRQGATLVGPTETLHATIMQRLCMHQREGARSQETQVVEEELPLLVRPAAAPSFCCRAAREAAAVHMLEQPHAQSALDGLR